METLFYTKIPKAYSVVLGILFIVICIITLGLGFILWYDFFIESKYWLNRRILWKYLNKKDISFTKQVVLEGIIEYKFKDFTLWYHTKQLELSTHNNEIGLFTSSFIEDRMVIKLIRKLNQLK